MIEMYVTTVMTVKEASVEKSDEKDAFFQMRVKKEFLKSLDELRQGGERIPSRAEVVRDLVEDALAEKRKGKRRTKHGT